MNWSPEAYEALLDELGPASALRVENAIEATIEIAEQNTIQFLLDGLGVESLRELHALVEEGQNFRKSVGLLMEEIVARERSSGE